MHKKPEAMTQKTRAAMKKKRITFCVVRTKCKPPEHTALERVITSTFLSRKRKVWRIKASQMNTFTNFVKPLDREKLNSEQII